MDICTSPSTCAGNPALRVGSRVELVDLGPFFSGVYRLTAVRRASSEMRWGRAMVSLLLEPGWPGTQRTYLRRGRPLKAEDAIAYGGDECPKGEVSLLFFG